MDLHARSFITTVPVVASDALVEYPLAIYRKLVVPPKLPLGSFTPSGAVFDLYWTEYCGPNELDCPTGPVGPVAPTKPCGPLGPVFPVGPNGPVRPS